MIKFNRYEKRHIKIEESIKEVLSCSYSYLNIPETMTYDASSDYSSAVYYSDIKMNITSLSSYL